jgi:hypothetical protein
LKTLALLALLVAGPAAAGALSDLVMAPGLFAEAGDGPLLAYAETRTVLDGAQEEDRLVLAMVAGPDGRKLELTQDVEGGEHPVAGFPPSSANPVLLYFLEASVRAMAEATGGSPFYIRNRMREALTAADLGVAGETREVVLRPFEGDRNRERMGVFKDLEVRLRFEEPERLLELSADTPGDGDGYHHRLTLTGED